MYKLNLVDIDRLLDDFENETDEANDQLHKSTTLNSNNEKSGEAPKLQEKTSEAAAEIKIESKEIQQSEDTKENRVEEEDNDSEEKLSLNSNSSTVNLLISKSEILDINCATSNLDDYTNINNTSFSIQDVDSINNKTSYSEDQMSNFKPLDYECIDENKSSSLETSPSSSPETTDDSSVTGSSKSTPDNPDSSSTTSDENFVQDRDENAISNLISSDIEQDSSRQDNVDRTVTTNKELTGSLSYTRLNTATEQITATPHIEITSTSSIVELSELRTENVQTETPKLDEMVNFKNCEEEDEDDDYEMDNKEIQKPGTESIEVIVKGMEAKNLIDKIVKMDNDNSEKKSLAFGLESTMDDISDNELESFLQELDELENEKKLDEDRISQASTVDCNESRFEAQEKSKVETATENESPAEDQGFTDNNSQELNEVASGVDALTLEESSNNDTENKEKTEETEANSESIASTSDHSMKNDLVRPSTLDLKVKNETEPVVVPEPTVEPNQIDSDQGLTSTSSSEFSAPINISTNEVMSDEDADDNTCKSNSATSSNQSGIAANQLGKVPPFWVPDNVTNHCMQCNLKFSVLKRRHHCRCCGLLLCSACCSLKAKLEYLGEEARICAHCDIILKKNAEQPENDDNGNEAASSSSTPRQPNPNNPMEYCSKIPISQQVSNQPTQQPISVMVPVSVLKKRGENSSSRADRKNVIFSDGIRPGCDLSELDENWNAKPMTSSSRSSSGRVQSPPGTIDKKFKFQTNLPFKDEQNNSFIPTGENLLPPTYTQIKSEYKYVDVINDERLLERLKNEDLKFAIQRNFYVICKIVTLGCCINKTVINFTTDGMAHCGQDEIIILLELDESNMLPKDVFLHLNDIYNDAEKGKTITEFGFSLAKTTNFLNSKENGGFLYIRPSFQCLQSIHLPLAPYLIGLLIHRWEIPWAKIFPLRLVLRLGALYRYYPCPLVSVRSRNSVYAEIGQTIMNFLADFRNYSYTVQSVRGMYILLEDRKTSVLIPKNRYDVIIKVINNSSDHILAFGGDFSKKADGHLVCIQNIESGCSETLSYSTQAINIQGQPRKVTGASFFILNGALKQNSGLSGKCSIVEDGLIIKILPNKMMSIREALKNMKNIEIICGPVDADEKQTEIVSIEWIENDLNFNVGVISPIDKKLLSGIPSIRVHRAIDYAHKNHIIRWTEVFIIKSDEDVSLNRTNRSINEDQINISKLAEQIARSTCVALVSFLELLAANNMTKIGLRVTLDQDNVCYEAGSSFNKLAPLYMKALDNIIGTLHRQATNLNIDSPIILELIFYILNK